MPRQKKPQRKHIKTQLKSDHRKIRVTNHSTDLRYADFSLQIRKIASLLQALQMEQEVETVVKVLQPGSLGIVEHKFTAEEIRNAKATVRRAVANWRINADIEKNSSILKDYVN